VLGEWVERGEGGREEEEEEEEEEQQQADADARSKEESCALEDRGGNIHRIVDLLEDRHCLFLKRLVPRMARERREFHLNRSHLSEDRGPTRPPRSGPLP
jgi:hypothetical protein